MSAILLFIEEEKPILGICRGSQVINVALGGTLEQHIPGRHKGYRTVKIQDGSWLYQTLGSSDDVYHSHHQCIDRIADDLVPTEWDAEDDRIEAFEHKDLPIYGLQWHPEKMEDDGLPVFENFYTVVEEDMKDADTQ